MVDFSRSAGHGCSSALLRSLLMLVMLAGPLLFVATRTQAQDAPTPNPALAAALDHTGSALQQTTLAQTQAGQIEDQIKMDLAAHAGEAGTATLSSQEQAELQVRITLLQQQWTVVSTALQLLNQTYMTLAQSSGADASADAGGATGSNIDLNQLISNVQGYTSQVQQSLEQVRSQGSGNVNLGTMFQLQFQMQIMSQYIESVSNTLSAINNEMMTMARATKGQ